MMNFMDAVNNMINGKRVIRQPWAGFYLCILPNQDYIWSVGQDSKNSTNSGIYTPSKVDINANDWIALKN